MADHDKKGLRTSALFRRLMNTSNIEQFMQRHASEMVVPSFHVYIGDICQQKGLVPEQVIKRADIERTYGHQLFNGTRRPSRDKVLQLAFGLQLDVEGAQKLLQIAQKSPLYPKIKRDAAILYCLTHHKNVLETQYLLHALQLTLLGDE
jgi:hypothetical protein